MDKESLIKFIKDNKTLILIALFAFLIRLFFLLKTYHQPLWWDESEYMGIAKNIALGVPVLLNPQRPLFLPIIESLLMFLRLGEPLIRFFLMVIPSTIVVVLTYLISKRIYNNLIAIISSIFMS